MQDQAKRWLRILQAAERMRPRYVCTCCRTACDCGCVAECPIHAIPTEGTCPYTNIPEEEDAE